MIVVVSDFGLAGPYTGQMKAAALRIAPAEPVIDLFADLPPGQPQPAAYLLAAYAAWFPAGTVFLCVVDPGVGGTRAALAIVADGRFYVGPDNGLFEIVLRRAQVSRCGAIAWSPPALSASFHGRDLFAPVAAMLARGDEFAALTRPAAAMRCPAWPDDLAEIVYIDRFGNALTGCRAATLPATARLAAGRLVFARRRTFGDVPAGAAFWYENSNGLAEIAVNRGRADALPGFAVGTPLAILA